MNPSTYYIIAAIVGMLGFAGTVVSGIVAVAILTFRTGKLISRVESQSANIESNQKGLAHQISKLVEAFDHFLEKLEDYGNRLSVLETKANIKKRK